MFKIIFISLNADDPLFENDLGILDKSFNTKEDALKHLYEVEFPKVEKDWREASVNEEEIEFVDVDIVKFADGGALEKNYYGDLVERCRYKVVEVK